MDAAALISMRAAGRTEPMALGLPDYVTACVSGIEVAVFGAGERSGPVVLVTHGRTGSMTDCFGTCRDLAAAGMAAVAVEQRNHGRRLVDARANAGWGPSTPADMYGVIVGTALDMSLLVDMLPARLGLDTSRAGVTGTSLGGHAALAAMSVDARFGACAALIGSGDFRRLMELRARANGAAEADFNAFFPEALERAVERYDPVRNAARFADRPLLMVNGEADGLVPAECNERLERALRPHYTRPERLRLSVHAGVGHEVTPAMWDEARAWLRRWLVDEPASSAAGVPPS